MNSQLIIGQGRLTTPAIYEDIKEPKKLKKEVTSMSYQNSKQNLKDDDLIQKANKILQEAIANKQDYVSFNKHEYSPSELAELGRVLSRLGYDVTASHEGQKIIHLSVNLTNYGNIQHGIINAYWTQAGNDDKEYHINVGKSVLINDLEFVLVHTIYSLIIRYIKLQGKALTNKNFNKALDEYIQAIRAQVGTMHDLKNRK